MQLDVCALIGRSSSQTVSVTEWHHTTLLFLDLDAYYFFVLDIFTVAKGSLYQDSIEKSWSEDEVHRNTMIFYLKIWKIVMVRAIFYS